MKTALVCIAKNEDNYIGEWIKYHTKLGFDYIYVYQNDWRYQGNKSQFNNVHWLEFDGEAKQLESYQNFINHHFNEYDWIAFFDVDEFLCFKNNDNVKTFLTEFDNYKAVGINWRLFGNNALTNVLNNNYSLINRFTMAEYIQNKHIKTILHAKKINTHIQFANAHCIKNSLTQDFTINTKKTSYIYGPFNTDFDNNVQINHYYSKTLEEYINNKHKRGRVDIPYAEYINNTYDIQKFSEHNKNDIEDLTAKKFYFGIL